MYYSIEEKLIIAVSSGCVFANDEYCDPAAIAAGYEDKIRVLYRESDFTPERQQVFDEFGLVEHTECPFSFGDGNAGVVTIVSAFFECGIRFVIFEDGQNFGTDFVPTSSRNL